MMNGQMVGMQGEFIVVLRPKLKMTKAEALRHAALLVSLADDDQKFPEILKEVQGE